LEGGDASVAQTFRRLSELGWVVLLVVAAVCAVIVVHDSTATPRSYSSGYDVTDPGRCAQGAGQAPVIPQSQVSVLDEAGRRIGDMRLRRSLKCATEWAQIVLTDTAARRLKGRVIRIDVRRPADNRRASYPLELHGGTVGFGNQLAATACIEGTAQLLAGRAQPSGPVARTGCI
jgi:hypothetical protein